MKKYSIFLFIAFIGCVEKNNSDLIQNPPTEISFTLEKNSIQNIIKSQVKSIRFLRKSNMFIRNSDEDSAYISRDKEFEIILENNDTLYLRLWIQKYESISMFRLIDSSATSLNQKWVYKNLEDEKSSFYNNFKEIRFDFGSHSLNYIKQNDNLKIEKVLKVIEEGKEKNYIEITFSGITYPWYPVNSSSQEVFTISGGSFKGVLE